MRFHSRHIEIDGYSAVCDIYSIQLLNTHELKILCKRGGKSGREQKNFSRKLPPEILATCRLAGPLLNTWPYISFPPGFMTAIIHDVIVCLGAVDYWIHANR